MSFVDGTILLSKSNKIFSYAKEEKRTKKNAPKSETRFIAYENGGGRDEHRKKIYEILYKTNACYSE